jgi:hypothetical protein
MVVVVQQEAGDQFMAVKPWLGAIVEPTVPPTVNPAVPDDELYLRWVHGYRALDSRNNLRYNNKGEVVYPTAALGVVYSTKKWQQRSVALAVLCCSLLFCAVLVVLRWL